MEDIVYFYPKGHESHRETGHPERPERVEAIVLGLEEMGWWQGYPHLDAMTVPREVLSSVHGPAYREILRAACFQGMYLDADTYTTPASWELALSSAGGAVAVAEAVWSGEARCGFALTRPPGHHATSDMGMGFCLLNNIAMAAEYLIQRHSAGRLAIVDLDLHHGNGTQDIFWERGDVFYFSTHQSPLYPGTGGLREIGAGPGEGRNANFPLPPASGDEAFRTVMTQLILPLLDGYNPQMILVSFGFDPHWKDPLGHLRLSAQVYGELIAALAGWAGDHCDGRIALFLEGGYDLDAARVCGQAAVSALLQRPWEDPLGPSPRAEGNSWQTVIEQARQLWGL